MKKFFSFFAAMLMAVSMVAATEASVTFSEEGYSNGQEVASVTVDEVVTITFAKGTNNNAPKYYTTGTAIRCYGGNSFTVSAKNAKLKTIALTFGSGDGTNEITTNVGTYASNAWEGESEEVIFTIGGTSGHRRIATVTVTYEAGEAPAVEAPVFSVAAGDYYDAQTVELSCATEGATIYYNTTGDWANAVEYTAAITVSETTTIYAQAVKGADKSKEVSKTYTIAKQYASLTALVNEAGTPAGQKVVVTLTNDKIDSLYVSSSKKVNGIYLTAAGRMVEIYCYDVPENWAVGGTVSGIVKGEWKAYYDTWEVCPSSWDGIEYTAPAAEWDGTVTLSKTSFASLADLEGITLTFNGATSVEFLGADADILALQNEDGSEMYAAWHPEFGGSYTIAGNVVTLTGWFDNTEEAPLPEQSATLYVEDYGAFKIDGVADYFETAEIAFETAGPTTYTVTYTVSGAVEEETSAQAGYYNESTEAVEFVVGANTVPENMIAYVSVSMLEGHTCEVKVNGTAVALEYNYWRGAIDADMTIEVIFDGGDETVEEELKYSKFVRDNATATGYTNFTYESASGATYKAHMMYQASNDSIQLRSTQTASTYYSGIVNTVAPKGMYIKSVSVEWAAGTVDARQLNIFTVDAPIVINDMFAQGATPNYTTVKSAGDKKIDVEGKHSYIGICSQAGAMYIKSITIEWAESGAPTALQNVEAVKVVKTIENGQLIIIRDGVRYNVVGAKF